MDEIIKELKRIINFKATTGVGDVVLVAVQNPQSVFYAVVSDIVRDDSKRDEWWHITLNILGVPPQKVVWTLRQEQFTGKEIFSMAGEGRFLQAVDFSSADSAEDTAVSKKGKQGKKAKSGLRLVK